MIALANVVVQANINAFGPMAMAGCGVYAKVEGFVFLPINSFAMALTTFVGQDLGANKAHRAAEGARWGMAILVLLAQAMGVVLFAAAPLCIALFDATPQVVAYGVARARSNALFFGLLAYTHGRGAVMRGSGRPVAPMVVMLVCWCGVRMVLLALVMPVYASIWVVYWVYPITWALSAAGMWLLKKLQTKESTI